MSSDCLAEKFADLINTGMKAVGSEIQAAVDGNLVILRDLFAEIDKEISFYRASDCAVPFQVMPLEALDSAASSMCMNVLTGIITRAIENADI